jgi:hypothetical protein
MSTNINELPQSPHGALTARETSPANAIKG